MKSSPITRPKYHVISELYFQQAALRKESAQVDRLWRYGAEEHAIRQVAQLGRSNVRPMVRLTMEPGQLASLCRRTVRSGHTGRLARNVARWLLPHGYIGVDLDLWTPTNKDEANATYYSSIVAVST